MSEMIQNFVATNYLIFLILGLCSVLILFTVIFGLHKTSKHMDSLRKLTTTNVAAIQRAQTECKMSTNNSMIVLAVLYDLVMSTPEDAQNKMAFMRTNLPIMNLGDENSMDPYRLNAMLSTMKNPNQNDIRKIVTEMISNMEGVFSDEFFSTVESYRVAMEALNSDLVQLSYNTKEHEIQCDKDRMISRVKKELHLKDSTHVSDRVANLFKDCKKPTLA